LGDLRNGRGRRVRRELIADTHLSKRDVRLAATYREHYPDEIDQAIAEKRPAEQWYALFPFVRRPPDR
jgi:hypothetical protein